MLQHTELLKVLRYNPATGNWFWRRQTRWTKKGDRADRLRKSTVCDHYFYRTVCINKKKWPAHVLAWFYMTKTWPPQEIDHEDNDATNNKWNNLRLATHSQNAANSRLRKDNTSGYKGISWCSRRRKWQVYINYSGKRISLGRFAVLDDAVKIRQAQHVAFFGEFARHA